MTISQLIVFYSLIFRVQRYCLQTWFEILRTGDGLFFFLYNMVSYMGRFLALNLLRRRGRRSQHHTGLAAGAILHWRHGAPLVRLYWAIWLLVSRRCEKKKRDVSCWWKKWRDRTELLGSCCCQFQQPEIPWNGRSGDKEGLVAW